MNRTAFSIALLAAALAWTGAPARAETPPDAPSPAAATPAGDLPKAQSGQIALPLHPREPQVSPMARKPGAAKTVRTLDRFELAVVLGGVYPAGYLDTQSDNGIQMGFQGTYYPFARLGFGMSVVHNDLGSATRYAETPVSAITEVGIFGKFLLGGEGALDPYLRLSSGFYTNRSRVFASASAAEPVRTADYGGVGVGIGAGLQIRTGTPTGWFVEALIQNDFADPRRAYVFTGFRGGMSFTFGGRPGGR